MALIAEEIVEEWLNRKGFFTIRGIKIGSHEIDLLAIKPKLEGIECRHLEVTVSANPVSYFTEKTAKKKNSIELERCVDAWVAKKFNNTKKEQLKSKLANGNWSRELVVGEVVFAEELELVREKSFTVHEFKTVIKELRSKDNIVGKAVGSNLVDLFLFSETE